MKKEQSAPETKIKFFRTAVVKQLSIAGWEKVKFEYLLNADGWQDNFTMTSKQKDVFEKWFVKEYMDVFKVPRKQAEIECAYFERDYGLKVQ